VATAVESASRREKTLALPSSRLSIPEAWHLLSLDAPTVAALWSYFFGRAMHIEIPGHAALLLAIGTWLVYVADRILDGYTARELRPRHEFHARHRTAFLATAVFAGSILTWLIVTRMTANARREDTVLFLIALIYLFLVHNTRGSSQPRLPKELAVGIVFAAATAVPVWSRLSSGRLMLLPGILVFAALCWLNCVAIERWENPGNAKAASRFTESHPTTIWAANHLRTVAFVFAASTAILAILQPPSAIYLAATISATGLAGIDLYRERFSTMTLRIAADAALLTPLLILPLTR
jgi:hypothetical protein